MQKKLFPAFSSTRNDPIAGPLQQPLGNQMAKLQDEIRQSKPFESLRQEAYLALQRTTDLAARPVEKVFFRWKLTPEQYNVLRILRGSEPRGLPTLEIGRRMITRASNVTRIIDRLESKNYVVRKRETRDRRIVRIRISKEGKDLLAEMDPAVVGAVDKAFERMSEEDARQLIEILERLREGVEAMNQR